MVTSVTKSRTEARSNRLRQSGNAAGGLLDAGLAAVSTFLMGSIVVRFLPTADLALYSSMFQAFVLCALLPTQLVYVPSQLSANVHSGRTGRLVAPDLLRDLRSHGVVVLVAAAVAATLGLPLAAQDGWDTYLPAAGGLFLLTIASPHQSHSRSVLHIAGRHGAAATVSAVTLAVQVVLLALPIAALASPQSSHLALGAVLLGSAVANMAGSALTVVLLRRLEVSPASDTPFRIRIGFLTAEGIAQLTGYLAVLIVAALLGTAAVAQLEAARVIASPVQVLVAGLLAFLVPRGVRAVATGDQATYRRLSRFITTVMIIAGAAYAAFSLLASAALGRLLDRVVQPELVSARVVVTTIDSCAVPSGMALFAMRRVLAGNIVAVIANAVQLAVIPVALLVLGPIGMSVGQAAGSAVKVIGFGHVARGIMREQVAANPAPA